MPWKPIREQPILTELINESAKDFQNIAVKGIASDNDYQNAIEKMGFKVTKKALVYIGERLEVVNL